MAIHNVMEEVVSGSVETIFNSIQKSGNTEGFCFCEQCRLDTICYVLNRSRPYYIVSNRGAARLKQESIEWQQMEADVSSLIYKALKQVNHNMRPSTVHHSPHESTVDSSRPVYNIPIIKGRIFDGSTFEPLSGVKVELRWKGELVKMRDQNWQNPYTLVANTAGNFTFWPSPITAEVSEDLKEFEYSITMEAPEYETKIQYIKIPVVSKIQTSASFSIERSFKLPDIYMFPPGDAEQNG